MIKLKKRICSLILSVAIVASLSVFSFAAEDITIYSDNASAVAGQTISVPVKISDNYGFMGFSIILEFDDSVFTPVSVDTGDMLLNGSLTDSIGGTMQSNIVKVVYTGSSVVTEDGILFSVVFVCAVGCNGCGDGNGQHQHHKHGRHNDALVGKDLDHSFPEFGFLKIFPHKASHL